ncbi:MAG: hypothetical protein Q8Q52_04670, partial [Acidimicrobiia bacterium]|nr:hypothetical protein [Acidimicrobiia bacterium]
DPSDSDPRFHQQMVYAVIMKVIENFERALGRPFRFSGEKKLTVLPHAFEGENAFYDPATTSLHFGYFAADAEDPGENLPGQTVFSCLSHDIVAHETTHALVDRLRDHFNAPTNRDVLAFHEGLADIVAIFQHFSFPEVLRHEIRATRADLSRPGRLLELARQFGYATGSGQALRSATGLAGGTPDRKLYETVVEPHDRGSILVAAVFDAFFRIYRNRTADLIRAVSGGSGILPAGELQADLVTLATREAAQASQEVLIMCLRAFEYLPPVDVTFGDYLRAVVTADFELNPRDDFERRASFVDSFRARGIYAQNVLSLAEEALRLERPPGLESSYLPHNLVTNTLASEFDFYEGGLRKRRQATFAELHEFATLHAEALQLDPTLEIQIKGFHPSFHVGENGQLVVELVAQFVQTPKPEDPRRVEDGGVVLRGGTTAVFTADGSVRYIASRPLPGSHLVESQRELAEARVKDFKDYVGALDARDSLQVWSGSGYAASRMSRRADLGASHRSRRSWVPT